MLLVFFLFNPIEVCFGALPPLLGGGGGEDTGQWHLGHAALVMGVTLLQFGYPLLAF